MSVPQRHGGLRFLGLLLMIWGIIVIVLGLVGGLVMLFGNFWPGYNQGINMVGLGPVGLALCNGLPPLVLGAVLRLLTDVDYNSRLAVQSADQSRKAAEAAVKNGELLVKNSETVVRNTELAVKNTETAVKSTAALAAPVVSTVSSAASDVSSAAEAAVNTAAATASEVVTDAANTVTDAANTAAGVGTVILDAAKDAPK